MDQLKDYLLLALANHSYQQISRASRFSTRQLWEMAGGGPAVAKRTKAGTIEPKDDERYLALGRLIPSVDPYKVQTAAQRSYEQRKTERRQSARKTISSTGAVEILCAPLLELMRLDLLVEFEQRLRLQEQLPPIPSWLNPGRLDRKKIEVLSQYLTAQTEPVQATIAARLLLMAAYSADEQALGILIVEAARFLSERKKS